MTMLRLFSLSRRFYQDKSGSTAIEYGLIAALIFLGIVASVNTYTVSMSGTYTKISTSVAAANSK